MLASDHFGRRPPLASPVSASLIDVTLRDGGFVVNFDWTDEQIHTLVSGLASATQCTIELGYVGGLPAQHGRPRPGKSADLSPEHIHSITAKHAGPRWAVMVHPSALPSEVNYGALRDAGIGLVRFVYHPSWALEIQRAISRARESELSVSINIALSSRYTADEMSTTCHRLLACRPDLLYLADTGAAFLPNEVAAVAAELVRVADETVIGFHAHDFLSLALANSLAAAQAGAGSIDSSVFGLGRGGGNLRTELWLGLMQARGGSEVRLGALLPIRRLFARDGVCQPTDLLHLVSAALNMSPPEEDLVRRTASERHLDVEEVACLLLDCTGPQDSVDEAHLLRVFANG